MRPVILAAVTMIIVLFSFQNCSNKLMTPDTPVVDYSSVQSVVPDCRFNQSGLMNGDTVLAYRTSTVPSGQLCQSEIRTCLNSILSGSFEYAFCLPAGPAACLIDGRTIPHGGTIKVFERASVLFGVQCDEVSQLRTCNAGVLSGSYTFASCIVANAAHCTINGSTIENGRSQRFYRESTVPYLSSCVQEMRVCENGRLSGSYTHANCQSQTAQACSLNGITLQNGQNRTFFDRTGVPFGQTCPAGRTRTCNNGRMEGDANFQFANCTTANALSCTFNGQPLAHDAVVDAWSVATVPFGDTCETKKEVRRCTNSILSGSFTNPSCSVGPPLLNCRTADGVTMVHSQVASLYRAAFMRPPETCTSNGNLESAYCDNGTLRLGSGAGAVISGQRFFNCESQAHETQWEGLTSGGTLHSNVSCPAGQRTTGIFYGANGQNPDIDSIGVLCGTDGQQGPVVGTSLANPGFARCTGNKNVIGIYGQTMGFLNYTITICANDDGSAREPTGPYGSLQTVNASSIGLRTWYQMCQPGFVVSRLMVRTDRTIDGFNMGCVKVAQPANLNCEGVWLNQGCSDRNGQNPFYPKNIEQFHILQHKGGTGAECSTQNLANRAGQMNCQVDTGGGGGGGDGP